MKSNRTTSKRNAIIVAVMIIMAALLSACDDPTCDPTCGCSTDGTATTWAYCMLKK